MELQELKERFESAIGAFLNKEVDLLKNNINEETISTELTGYLREEFDDWQWNVDHLFDHRIKNNESVRKRIMLARDALPIDKIPKKIAEDKQEINKLIIPDIIFHDRYSGEHNFIVIEIKMSKNKSKNDRIFDRIKLEVMTSTDLQYKWGVFLDFTSGKEFNEEEPYKIEFVTNGEWQ